ncbi:hypothetical protein FBQ85_22055 [Cytophagia bacterium CHB2]|nr:hypothetical protein [Cytophagia bacterium CHB2]
MPALKHRPALVFLLAQSSFMLLCGPRTNSALEAQTVRAVATTKALAPDSTRVDFAKDIAPLVAQCQPCHFAGGKMYAQFPFDKPETIRKLGTQLFSRIKGEKEQALLRKFFAQKDDSTQARL